MPFLRESERSVRWYFIVYGVLAVLIGLGDYSTLNLDSGLPLDVALAVHVPIATRLALGIAFVIAGVRLTAALRTGAVWVQRMLVASALAVLLEGALLHAVAPTLAEDRIPAIAFGVGISIYLLYNIRRLSAERREREAILPPPPAARVV